LAKEVEDGSIGSDDDDEEEDECRQTRVVDGEAMVPNCLRGRNSSQAAWRLFRIRETSLWNDWKSSVALAKSRVMVMVMPAPLPLSWDQDCDEWLLGRWTFQSQISTSATGTGTVPKPETLPSGGAVNCSTIMVMVP
jgi:hypothetical protein